MLTLHRYLADSTVAVPAIQVLLSFDLYIGNHAGLFATPTAPESLDFGINRANQQVRVDVLSVTADDFSLAILQNTYQSNAGNDLASGYNRISMDITFLVNANLSNMLRLRFAEVGNLGPLRAGINNVAIDVIAGAVPEPSSFLLLAAGLLGAWGVRRQSVSDHRDRM